MYEKFYGFSEKPFQLVPNPGFLFFSSKHQNALTYLEYGLSEGSGFILLTGDIGSGKTTLVRYLLNRIEKNIEVGVLFNTNVESGDLLALVMQEFNLSSTLTSKSAYLDIIFHHLIERYAHGKRVLLVIDEAQNLSPSALEEVRMLSNLQTDDQLLLQVMLVGQPELKRKLSARSLAQLSQRIAVHYHLGALSQEEVHEYIAFRLEKVGGAVDIFAREAVELIFRASGGIPRVVNLLCDTALVYAYGESLGQVNVEVVEQVIRDKEGFGLIEQESSGTQDSCPGEVVGPDHEARLDADQIARIRALEAKVNWLQVQIEGQVEQASQFGAQATQRLITELTTLLEREREKTERLLLERGQLLARLEGRSGSEPEPEKDAGAVAKDGGRQGLPERKTQRPGEAETKRWYQRVWSGAK